MLGEQVELESGCHWARIPWKGQKALGHDWGGAWYLFSVLCGDLLVLAVEGYPECPSTTCSWNGGVGILKRGVSCFESFMGRPRAWVGSGRVDDKQLAGGASV